MPGSEFIEALNMPVVIVLVSLMFIMATGLSVFVSWKLSKIDSNVNYLLRSAKENHEEHDKLWQAMEDNKEIVSSMRETVGELKGRIGG